MLILKACAVCLTTDLKLNDINNGQLRQEYNMASGLKTEQCIGIPQHLCVYCTAYVKRFAKFRQKCQLAHFILKKILDTNKQIKPSHLQALNTNVLGLKPTLSFMGLKNCHLEEIKFQCEELNSPGVAQRIKVPIAHSSTHENMTIPVASQSNVNNRLVLETSTWRCIKKKSSSPKNIVTNENVSETDNNCLQNADKVVSMDSDDELFNEENVEVASVEMNEESDKTKEETNEIEVENFKSIENANGDGCNLEPEYAKMIPMSMIEAKAVLEDYKLRGKGKYKCEICKKCYTNPNRLDEHLRMHNTHVSGPYLCELCHYYYKTDFLLKTHVTEKHMYKYLCRECPELNYERASAKQHYIRAHLKSYRNGKDDLYETRPVCITKDGERRVIGIVTSKYVRKTHKLPQDFLMYSPIPQEDQYRIVNERQKSKNYITSKFKCEFCFRGYRNINAYNNHMRRHDPVSGSLECDMCKGRFKTTSQVRDHMITCHLHRYTCQHCGFVCFCRKKAQEHYKFHKDVVYPCPHCDKTFKKLPSRFTHVRVSHPSTFICNLCGNGFISETGLSYHKIRTHSKQEVESSALISAEAEARADAMSDPLFCADCQVRFVSQGAFDTHLRSSSKHTETNLYYRYNNEDTGRRRKRLRRDTEVHNRGLAMATTCKLCLKHLPNDISARDHHRAMHPGVPFPKRFMCEVCGQTTQLYSNLMIHMRVHTKEKPYDCPHCNRTFGDRSTRNRHLRVHTGEKPYICEICSRRFSQKGVLKLHIKTVHLKIPHPAWDKRNRRRRQANRPLKAAEPSEAPNQEDASHNADYLAAFINHTNE